MSLVNVLDWVLSKVLGGTRHERYLRKRQPEVDAINALAEGLERLSDQQLHEKTAEFRRRLSDGETVDDLLVEAFAAVRESGRRFLGLRHYDVQLLGGMVLHAGKIAEMVTGEGKTLVATAPAFLNALVGKGVHIVTVNDYLAQRDRDWMAPVYEGLGMTVGCIQASMSPNERQPQYHSDITYGTNNEFGFDYLRDNMKAALDRQVQGPLHYAIVDEVDSILVDEARTPLIISGSSHDDSEKYRVADRVVRKLGAPNRETMSNAFFEVKEKDHRVDLTERGLAKVEDLLAVGSLWEGSNMQWPHLITNALKAHHLYHKEKEYVVKDGDVVIVDEFTGRLMEGRRWSDGQHQAIEAKEEADRSGVRIKEEQRTLATITLQNYFKLYTKLAGMTGTALTEAEEFAKIYGLDVVVVPTNMPLIRKRFNDLIFGSGQEKLDAIADEVERVTVLGRPVLVGTTSIENSEALSVKLKQRQIPHVVLNAKRHKEEAAIVAQAGRTGAVTIATNMAGRGTDILLGGNPSYYILGDINQHEHKDRFLELLGKYLTSPLNKATAQEFDDTLTLLRRDHHLERLTEDEAAVLAELEGIIKKHEAECRANKERVLDPAKFNLKALGLDDPKTAEEQVPWWFEAHTQGGLHIIGTERHESRRIDNQLRGRCGRQGDPGSSQFFLSLEDDLMRIFAGDRMRGLLRTFGLKDGQPIQHRIVTRSLETAQKKVEARNFDIRKNLLEYDEVMDRQRKTLYTLRQGALEGLVTFDRDEVIAAQLRLPRAKHQSLASNGALTFDAWYAWWQQARKEHGTLPAPTDDDVLLPEFTEPFKARLAFFFRVLRIPRSVRIELGMDTVKDLTYELWQSWFAEHAAHGARITLEEDDVFEPLPDPLRRQHLRVTTLRFIMATVERVVDRHAHATLPAKLWDLETLADNLNDRFAEEIEPVSVKELKRHTLEELAEKLRERVLWQKDARLAEIKHTTRKLKKRDLEAYVTRFQEEYAITFDEEELENARHVTIDSMETFFVGLYKDRAQARREREIGRGRLEELTEIIEDATGGWDLIGLLLWLARALRIELHPDDLVGKNRDEAMEFIEARVRKAYAARERQLGADQLAVIEQFVLLETIDARWKDHLLEMDYLRSAVAFEGYAQRDPKIEYKKRGLDAFQQMLTIIEDRFTETIFHVSLGTEQHDDLFESLDDRWSGGEATKEEAAGALTGEGASAEMERAAGRDLSNEPVKQIRRDQPKVGRNDPCPCGSGRKFKKCHGTG